MARQKSTTSKSKKSLKSKRFLAMLLSFVLIVSTVSISPTIKVNASTIEQTQETGTQENQEPEQTDLGGGESDITDPGESDITDPGETDITDPGESDITDPGETDITDPGETDITNPGETDITDPGETDITDPGETDITDPGETDITDPGETDITDPVNGLETEVPEPLMGIVPASVGKVVVTASLSTDAATIAPKSGESFNLTYNLSGVANPYDATEKIEGLKAEITIPSNLTVGNLVNTTKYTVGTPVTHSDSSKTYTFTFIGTPTPGTSFAQINIPITFNAGVNPSKIEGDADNIFSPELTITGNNIDTMVVNTFNGGSTPADIIPQNTGAWTLYKTKIAPNGRGGDTYVNSPTTYEIQLSGAPTIGGVNLDVGAKVIEKIPAEAEYVSHDVTYGWTGVYDGTTTPKTVTWTKTTSATVGYYTYFYVTLKYPNATDGATTVTNNVDLQANYVRNATTVLDTESTAHKVIVQPEPSGQLFTKTVSRASVAVDDPVFFTLSQVNSVFTKSGSADGLKEYIVVDDPLRNPTQNAWGGQSDFYEYFDFTSLSISSFSTKQYPERGNETVNASDIKIKLSFQTKNERTWHDYMPITTALTSIQTITKEQFLSTGSFAPDDNVTLVRVRYTYKDDTANFSFPGDFIMPSITYNGVAKKDGTGSTAQNTAYFYVKFNDNTYNVNNNVLHGYEADFDNNTNFVTVMYNITEAKPYIYNSMTNIKSPVTSTGYIYQPGETVQLTITGRNATYSTGTTATGTFKTPEEYILIPVDYQIKSVSVSASGMGFNVDTPINFANDPNNTNLRTITYTDGLQYKVIKITSPTGAVPMGSYYYIYVDVIVPQNAANFADFHRITMSVSHPLASDYNGANQPGYDTTATSDVYDFNDDGIKATVAYTKKLKINVLRTLLFSSTKYVGATKTSYGNYATVTQGSDFYYKLELNNVSPYTSADKLRVIDILPSIEDTGVFATTGAPPQRGSEWAPTNYMFEYATAGATVYSTDVLPTPDQIRLELQDVTNTSGITWHSGVLTGAKAIKIEKMTATAPQEKVIVELKAKAKAMGPTDPPLIAWNSFAYGANYSNGFNGNINMPVAEPPKVGVYVTPSPPIKLSGVVWNDADKNGTRETGETLLSGIKVSLFSSTGSLLGITTTNANGAYEFKDLASNLDYTVKIGKPMDNKYTLTTGNIGSDTTVDSDFTAPSPADSYLGTKTVTTGIVDITNVDAGLFTNGISGVVWNDLDKNGLRDLNETLLSGVTVQLYSGNTLVGTVVTLVNGEYNFPGLPNGNYTVKIKSPTDIEYTLTQSNHGTDNTINSDFANTTGIYIGVANVNLNGADVKNVDAGLFTNGISGVVWYDLDKNGLRESNETLLDNVSVELYNGTTLVGTVVTLADGAYNFPDLPNGNYTVKIKSPTEVTYTLTQSNQGTNTTIDSDFTNGTGIYICVADVTLNGADITHVDAGFTRNGISGVVWYDYSRDGICDSGEKLLKDFVVNLYKEDGTFISTTTTDLNGAYQFNGLSDQKYILKIEKHNNSPFTLTPSNQGIDPDINSDYLSDEVFMGIIDVTMHGTDITHIDAGLVANRINGIVWYDINKDGIRDSNETIIPGMTVELYDENNTKVAEIVTDANGEYQFEELSDQTYTLEIVKSPTFNYVTTKINQGEDLTVNSDYSLSSGLYVGKSVVTLNGIDSTNVDAGLVTNDIQGVLWYDYNKDGIRDSFEPVLDGFTVELYNELGVKVYSQPTDADGAYCFENVSIQNYTLKIVRPAETEFSLTKQNQGENTTIDSNYELSQGTDYLGTIIVAVTGEDIRYIDAGFTTKKTSLSITLTDPNGKPIPHGEFEVRVKNPDGTYTIVTTVISDADGNLISEPLQPGEYVLVQTDTSSDFIYDETYSYTFNVTGEETNVVTKTVINEPKNGIKVVVVYDNGKPVSNANINLVYANGTKVQLTTNEQGKVYTDNLPPGDYTLQIDVPKGFTVTSKDIKVTIPENSTETMEIKYTFQKITQQPSGNAGSTGGSSYLHQTQKPQSEDLGPIKEAKQPIDENKEPAPETTDLNKVNDTTVEESTQTSNQPTVEESTQTSNQPTVEESTQTFNQSTVGNATITNTDREEGFNAIDISQNGEKISVDFNNDNFKVSPDVMYYDEFSDDMVPLGYSKVEKVDADGTTYWMIELDDVPLGTKLKVNPETGDIRQNTQNFSYTLLYAAWILFTLLENSKKTTLKGFK